MPSMNANPDDLNCKTEHWRMLSVWSCSVSIVTTFAAFVLVGALDGYTPINVLFLFISITALNLSLIAAIKDSGQKGRFPTAKKWARVTVVAFAVYVNIEGVQIARESVRTRMELKNRSKLEAEIRLIIQNCAINAAANNDRYPSSLMSLVDSGNISATDLRDASSVRQDGLFVPEQLPGYVKRPADDHQFVFLLPNVIANKNDDRVLLYDPVMHNGLVLTGFENVEAKWVSPSELRDLLTANIRK